MTASTSWALDEPLTAAYWTARTFSMPDRRPVIGRPIMAWKVWASLVLSMRSSSSGDGITRR